MKKGEKEMSLPKKFRTYLAAVTTRRVIAKIY